MINSKRELLRRLQNDKTSLEFKTLYNVWGKFEGQTRQVKNVQSNAFTLIGYKDDKEIESWTYINNKDIEVKDNHIYYYGYFYEVYKAEQFIKNNNIPKEYQNIITLKDNDSINNGRSIKYLFKVKIIDILIIEK